MDGLTAQLITEAPNIPETISEIGKDFLWRCFTRDSSDRWTVEMLLRHPFYP
jgi:serine/threonine protein kinase